MKTGRFDSQRRDASHRQVIDSRFPFSGRHSAGMMRAQESLTDSFFVLANKL